MNDEGGGTEGGSGVAEIDTVWIYYGMGKCDHAECDAHNSIDSSAYLRAKGG